MKICSVEWCKRKHEAKGFCGIHYQRWKRLGSPLAKMSNQPYGNSVNRIGYKVYAEKLQHTIIAENALGKPLPEGAIVHHVNKIRTDNRNENLVICDRAYHSTIHMRMRALKDSGNANFKKCCYCGRYDDPVNMYIPLKGGSGYHNECRRIKANRQPKLITYGGKSMRLKEWAEYLGTKSSSILYRLNTLKLPLETALSVPFSKSNRRLK